jgi:NitT/TauT family transport system substrate-binding protein
MSLIRIRTFSAAAACALAACTQEPPKPAEPDIVKVARSTLLTNAPLAIGDEEGIFARENIRLEYIAVPGVTVQSLPALQQGDIDVLSAVMSIGLVNGVGSGATFRIVADRGYVDPTGCEPFGIIGRKTLILSKYLERFGLTLGDMKLVRLPPSVEPQAMDVGNVDIVTRGDPHFYNMMSQGHRLLAGAREVSPETHLAVFVYGPTFLGEKRDVGRRFMKAYLAAVRQYNEGPTPRNVEIVSRRLGMESDALKEMCWPTTREDGRINTRSLTDYQEWAVRSGNLDKVIPPEQLIDTTFAAGARKEL